MAAASILSSSFPPAMLLGVPLLAIFMTVYPTSSSSNSSTSFPSWLALFSILDRIFHHWIPYGYVPLYTWAVFMYITARYYYYESGEAPEKKKSKRASIPLATPESKEPQPIDLSGTYKLMENHNFQQLLQAQGVPWFLVKAADQARPTHHITHQGNALTIQIQGIIESETHYVVGGHPVETNIRGRPFRDHVTYMKLKDSIMDAESNDENADPDGIVGIQTHKEAVDDGYKIMVQRRLLKEDKKIVMTSRVTFDDDEDGSKTVTCTQIFQMEE